MKKVSGGFGSGFQSACRLLIIGNLSVLKLAVFRNGVRLQFFSAFRTEFGIVVDFFLAKRTFHEHISKTDSLSNYHR